METRTLDSALVAEYRTQLEDVFQEELSVAIIGQDAEHWPEAVAAAESCAARVVLLEEGLLLHDYKRILNEHHCGCLMYSRDYDELAYRINNDGVTYVSDYIEIT